MKADYQKFANEGFLRTIDAGLLHRFMSRHMIAQADLDIELLLTNPTAGRTALGKFLLGPNKSCSESLTEDLHRIAKLDRREGLDILLHEAKRAGISLYEGGEALKATPRNVALRTFIRHHEVFEAAEIALDFLQPASLAEFACPEEGIEADLTPTVVQAMEQAARRIFESELHGKFCQAATHEDVGEVHLSILHGAYLQTHEILTETRRQIVSFREIDKVVLAYSALDGRLKVWGGTKAHRTALAQAFAHLALGRPGLFTALEARRLYTLEPAERSRGAFVFRREHDEEIESVKIYEAQANRIELNPRSQAERTIFSVLVRDTGGHALRLLHENRPDISYWRGWRLDHLTLKVMLRTSGRRLHALTVKIRPPETVSFQRYRHQARIINLLRLNGMTCDRDVSGTAMAAE